MKNGATVATFERAFAHYVGAKYAIACSNGTVTLQAALVASGYDRGAVSVPPLTMSATTMAVLNVGARPVFLDIDPRTWLVEWRGRDVVRFTIGVSLYGLHFPGINRFLSIDDAAQTLRPHNPASAFTSYSFQASKILSTGEGGMLVTNDGALAAHARSYLSLGYDLQADQPRIDPAAIKRPDYVRHVRGGINGRMNDATAALGLERLSRADGLKTARRLAASMYADVVRGCDWITPQFVPDGWTHDYWAYAFAVRDAAMQRPLCDAIVRHGGELPYGAWRLTFDEPAFSHLRNCGTTGKSCVDLDVCHVAGCQQRVTCPVADDLQPRLVQMQTNKLASAARNAEALARAIRELGG